MPQASLPIIFATSLLVGLSGALSPGPLLILDIREAMRRGIWAGPLVSLGHGLLELAVTIALYLGLSRYFQEGHTLATIGLLGGGFLLWMAWGLLRHPGRVPPSQLSAQPGDLTGLLRPVAGGALVSLSNPYWVLWWATLGVTYLTWARALGIAGLVAFYAGHILADLSWYSAVAAAVASGRRLMGDRMYRRVMLTCGLFLLGLGAYFFATGAEALLND